MAAKELILLPGKGNISFDCDHKKGNSGKVEWRENRLSMLLNGNFSGTDTARKNRGIEYRYSIPLGFFSGIEYRY
jgi:hypothetical protein